MSAENMTDADAVVSPVTMRAAGPRALHRVIIVAAAIFIIVAAAILAVGFRYLPDRRAQHFGDLPVSGGITTMTLMLGNPGTDTQFSFKY
jgi:hypothetical protein